MREQIKFSAPKRGQEFFFDFQKNILPPHVFTDNFLKWLEWFWVIQKYRAAELFSFSQWGYSERFRNDLWIQVQHYPSDYLSVRPPVRLSVRPSLSVCMTCKLAVNRDLLKMAFFPGNIKCSWLFWAIQKWLLDSRTALSVRPSVCPSVRCPSIHICPSVFVSLYALQN